MLSSYQLCVFGCDCVMGAGCLGVVRKGVTVCECVVYGVEVSVWDCFSWGERVCVCVCGVGVGAVLRTG